MSWRGGGVWAAEDPHGVDRDPSTLLLRPEVESRLALFQERTRLVVEMNKGKNTKGGRVLDRTEEEPW